MAVLRHRNSENHPMRQRLNRHHPLTNSILDFTRQPAFLFLLPTFVLLGAFVAIPLIYGFILSFYQWSGFGPMTFVGLANFHRALTDTTFWHSMLRTLWYVMGTTIGCNILGLCFALALFSRLRGWRFFRTLLFLSNVAPITAMGILWALILSPSNGLLNSIIQSLGLRHFEGLWLANPHLAMPLVIFVGIWQEVGIPMLLYSAGLNRISEELFEAAKLDGAKGFRRLWSITLPLLTPVMAVTTILLVVWSIQVFASIWVMTGGGPGYATYVVGLYLYHSGFGYSQFGYANAMSIVVAIIAGVGMLGLLTVVKRINTIW